MASLNEATLIGYLGKDPEIRYMPNGDPVASISIGTTESWKDRETGEEKEHTEWHRVTIYGKALIENFVSKYLKKGSQVWLRGNLRTRKWVDKETRQDRYATEIRSDSIKLLDRAPKNMSVPQEQSPLPGDPLEDIPF